MRRTLVVVALVTGLAVPAAAQMPDVSQMSGIPLPMGDLPNGTIAVRVVRGDLSNNVVKHPVELHGGPSVLKVDTDDSGRAQFTGLAPGTEVHAVTEVDGQRLESQPFAVPAAGGIRLVLVAGAKAGSPHGAAPGAATPGPTGAAPGAAAATPGTVAIGGQSRVVIELTDEQAEVYYLFEVLNNSQTPVSTAPLVFEMPAGAQALSVLDGSTPQAQAAGNTATVSGPFAPGRTIVQLAYRLQYDGGRLSFTQKIPVAWTQTAIITKKLEGVQFNSAQAANRSDMTTAGGETYVVASGGAVAAGGTFDVDLSGLPHHSPWPKYTALALALGVVVFGAWLASGTFSDAERQRLEARRTQLLADLVRMEDQHRHGHGDARKYAQRRERLVGDLEQIYAELDALGVVPSPAAAAATPDPVGTPAGVA